MADIVERARAAQNDDRLSTGALYGELADEIERLREVLDKMLTWADVLFPLVSEDQVGSLVADYDKASILIDKKKEKADG